MAKNKPTKVSSRQAVLNWRTLLLTVLACMMLLVSNSALWANRVFFNTERFTELTTQAVLSQSSREAIAREVVEVSLEGRPAVKRVVSGTATKLISGLLDTNLASSAVDKVVALLQTTLTSARPQPITIDLSGIKGTLQQLIDLTNREQAEQKLDSVPNEITVLDTNKLPDFYKSGQALLLLGPITAILSLIMLAYPHMRRRSYEYSARLLLLQGPIIVVTGLLALAIGPIFRPTVLAQVNSFNLRILVQNIYNSFINSFNSQSMWLIWLGVVVFSVPVLISIYNSVLVKNLKRKFIK